MMNAPLDRRTFVSRFVLGSVTSLFAGRLSTARVLGTILSGPEGVLKVRVSEHAALGAANGSIKLNFSGSTPHPVLINRGADAAGVPVFYTMDSDCQHEHCTVRAYNPSIVVSTTPPVTGAVRCGCHGSLYAIDGALLGGPATRGLNTFANTFDGVDTLSVVIPGLHFSVTEIAVQATDPALRLRLRTDILPYSTYRVSFQAELTDAPQVIPFSLTPTGTPDRTSAFTTTSPIDLYVDATTVRGFYTVALVGTPV